MPKRVWLSRTAWLYDRPSATCVALAEAVQTVSHDRLTRLLQRDWAGHPRLDVVCRTLFVWHRGLLMIDATGLPQPLASAIEPLAWGIRVRSPSPAMASPWSASSGRTGDSAFHEVSASGTKVAPQRTPSPGSG
jgi:hypothetical protein